jgi:CheY-like chemotaxis protein
MEWRSIRVSGIDGRGRVTSALLWIGVLLQGLAVAYGLYLLSRREGAVGAWLFLLSAMFSMLAWRIVVMVEDEDDVRAALTRLLEQMGARVTALSSGVGIEAALSAERPEILILDVGMPEEDGYMLIRRIRRLPAAAGGATPAISLTAHARDEDRARAFAAGFQRHLPKPIDVQTLAAAIRELRAPDRAESAPATSRM